MKLKKDHLKGYPPEIVDSLAFLATEKQVDIYLTGGAVRDWLLGTLSNDLDITVSADAIECARLLAGKLKAAFIPLDEEQGVARIVRHGLTIDISSFREGTCAIEDDLRLRDFTTNALAVSFDPKTKGLRRPFRVIDPLDGSDDCQKKCIRATSRAVFEKDPLRLLRAYRFMAELDFSLDAETEKKIRLQSSLITHAAPERITYELHKIMLSSRVYDTFLKMSEQGLLDRIFPELKSGKGVDQPASHHLDVYGHNLKALYWMEKIQHAPGDYFPSFEKALSQYLAEGNRTVNLKWAALFHDFGKPDTCKIRDARITFYNHDQTGARNFIEVGKRLRWSREDTKAVARFIELHMWPFHLNNVRGRTGGITARACLRLVKAAGDSLPGLFILAMADSLAGEGPDKPVGMEESLAALYQEVDEVFQKNIKPVIEKPRLLTGHDLKNLFGLVPGPQFREILDGLERAQVAGEIRKREEALAWTRSFLKESQR